MNILSCVKSSFDDKGYFIMRDAAFGTAGAIISGCFLRRFISIHPPLEGAIYVLIQTITAHLLNRAIGGEKDIERSDLCRHIISFIFGVKVAQRVIPLHLGKWTLESSSLISSVIRVVVLRGGR